jgi:VWFA-related protein
VLVVSAVLALAGVSLRGDQAAPAPPAGDQQQPIFRARVDLVTSDVIVRDSRGQFIADLKKEEFEIYEDGILQEIVSMVLVHGGRTFNAVTPPPPPTAEGIILPAKRPVNDAAGRIFIIFVDDLHLDFRNTGRIRQLFEKISKTLIHEGDMFGIVSTGPSSLSIDLTYDMSRLGEAIKKIAGNGLKPSDILQAPEGAEGPSEVRYRAHVAFSTAYDILKKLENVHNRRKAFIYVSNGYDFNPFPQSRATQSPFNTNYARGGEETYIDPFSQQNNRFAEADLVRELAELTRAANRANTTMYTIDPRGLVGGPDLDETVDPVEWSDYVRTSQDSLRVIAEETGGLAVVNQNDFDKALKRIDAETSDYYVLGFYSSNPDPLRRTRRIEVKVKRPDLQVWSRPQYTLRPTPAVSSR